MSTQAVVKSPVQAAAQTALQKFFVVNKAAIQDVIAVNESRHIMQITAAIYKNPQLLKCSPFSLLNGVVLAHQLKLNLGTPEVYLIPFKAEATLIIGYQGKIKLALASGIVTAVEPELVMNSDHFVYKRTHAGLHFEHEPNWKARSAEAASETTVAGAYCQVRIHGETMTRFCPLHEILAARGRSRSYGSGSSPWKTDFGAMALKTAVHRAMKFVPQDPGLHLAAQIDDSEQGGSPVVSELLEPAKFLPEAKNAPLIQVSADDSALKILIHEGAEYTVDGGDFEYFSAQNDGMLEPDLIKAYLVEHKRIKPERTA